MGDAMSNEFMSEQDLLNEITATKGKGKAMGDIDEVEDPRKTLSDGTQIYPAHREIDPETGMQKGYVVLAEEERAVSKIGEAGK